MTARERSRVFHRRGWAPLPVPFRTKRPTLKGWPDLRLTEDELGAHFNGAPQNVGVILGAPSGNLVDIDLDAREAMALADRFLPRTGSEFGRASKPRSHRLYYVAPLVETTKFPDVDKASDTDATAMLVELRSTGAQTIFPGSVHESGEAIEFYTDGDPAHVDGETLLGTVRRLAAAALLARHWPEKGTRHETVLAAAGFLLRRGLDVADVTQILTAAATLADPSADLGIVRTDVRGTAAKLRAGATVTGGPRLADQLRGDGDKVVTLLQRWLGADVEASDWPAPEPVPDDLRPVPEFDVDQLLPEAFAPWARDVAERAQCPVDFVGVGVVVAAGAVVGRQLTIRPKQRDDWTVVPNLWALAIGRPGLMKTAAMHEALSTGACIGSSPRRRRPTSVRLTTTPSASPRPRRSAPPSTGSSRMRRAKASQPRGCARRSRPPASPTPRWSAAISSMIPRWRNSASC
jgi:hypothetical protein